MDRPPAPLPPTPSAAVGPAPTLDRHWRRVQTLMLLGIAAWLGVTVTVVWWADALNRYTIAGTPAGYWWSSQGAIGAFLLIILVHGVLVERLERRPRTPDADRTSDPT